MEEISERIVLAKSDEYDCIVDPDRSIVSASQEKGYIEQPLDVNEVTQALQRIASKGFTSIAVCFLHSYMFPVHEKLVRDIALSLGCFSQISLSSEVMNMIRMVPRGVTTSVDAYLTPIITRYLQSFCSGFDEGTLFESNMRYGGM